MLFDPNEMVQENTVVGQLVKTLILMLQRCLKSKNQSIFNAALQQVSDVSDNYGPALNKHLAVIWPLIEKRKDLKSAHKIEELKVTL